MEKTIKCPHCRNVIAIEDSFIGREVICPVCGKTFVVQVPTESQPIPAGAETAAFQQGAQQVMRTCKLATASLILGILAFFCVWPSAIAAIICGCMALSRIKRSNGQLGGLASAIWGIVLGIILPLISTIIILLSMLLPALSKARDKARDIACASRLKQVGLAIILYSDDNGGYIPENMEVIETGYLDCTCLSCPSTGAAYELDDSVKGRPLGKFKEPHLQPLSVCHHDRNNTEITLYADGHVETKRH